MDTATIIRFIMAGYIGWVLAEILTATWQKNGVVSTTLKVRWALKVVVVFFIGVILGRGY